MKKTPSQKLSEFVTKDMRPRDALIWKDADPKGRGEFIKEGEPGVLVVRVFGQPAHSRISRSIIKCVVPGYLITPSERTVPAGVPPG